MIDSNNTVTVVTVVYNGVHFIEETIKSVVSQSYPHIEYIIIDGGSTDGTCEIIKKYSEHISYWVSESDKGIYDAMNKAIDKANGRWINFMNAGDYFHSNDSINNIFDADINFEDYAAVYGDAEFRLKNIAYIKESGDNTDSSGFMPFSHQAVFVRTDVAKKYKFELKYRITADTAFFLRLMKEGYKLKRVPVIVCSYYAAEGMSVDNEVSRSKEIIDMQVDFNNIDPNAPYFKNYLRNARIKGLLKKMIPSSVWLNFRENKIKKGNSYRQL